MRQYGTMHPTEFAEMPPDATQILLIANSSGQAMDLPSGAQIVEFTGISTAGAQLNFMVNLQSTAAQAPSSGSSGGSTGIGHMVMGRKVFQLPGSSTGWSAAAVSSGYICANFWKK